ncbi:MAG: hypothetical protein R3B45_07545 [Bdellovibrionota bacterium]
MKNQIKIFGILCGALVAFISPLKAGINDGTLPLKLVGKAINLNTQSQPGVAATVVFQKIDKNDLGNQATFKCQSIDPNQTRHNATGWIQVGTKRYSIKGICITPQGNQEKIEVMANTGNTGARLNGIFSESVREKLIDGKVNTDQPRGQKERYKLNVKSK